MSQNFLKQHSKTEPAPPVESDLINAVFDTVETLIVVIDRRGRIVRFNRACETTTGYTLDEVKGQRLWDLFLLPHEKTAVRAVFAELVAGRFPNKSENVWITKDGRHRLIAWSNTAIPDANGEVAYVIGAGNDITARQQTALLLNASESLQRVTTALLQHLTTLGDVLSIVCSEALQLTGATGSAVLLLEDETWLQVTSSSGTPTPAEERLPISDSSAGVVIDRGEPLLLNEPQGQKQAYRNPDIKTLLAVPLCVNDTTLGVLDVVNKPGGFTAEDVQVMQLFADQAAIAIEHAQLHEQAEKLAVIEERQRLARELHDSVTQALYSVILYADATRMALTAEKRDVALEHLNELRTMAREAMMDMRLLIFELHPPVLEKEGLVTAVQSRLEAVEARSGLQTALKVMGDEVRLPLALEEELYRIVQEGLNNAVKHARAQQVTVILHYHDDALDLEVRDDGRGFDPAHPGGGMGLRGIEERVARIGGRLTIKSTPESGTTLKVEVGS